jgi:hypothetical protein
MCPVAKSLMNRDRQKAPIAIHGSLGTTYHQNEKANVIADSSENQFTSHNQCDATMSGGWRLESKLCSHF